MGDLLESLLRLQEIATRLAAMRRKRGVKTRQIESQKRRVRGTEDKLRQRLQAIREQQVRLDALTLDVAAREQEIAKQRQALNKARTNKEYAAILTIINTSKADNSKLESTVLQLMEQNQALKGDGAHIETERAKLLTDVGATEKRLEAFDEAHREELAELEASRDECAKNIPPTAFALFTRAADRHEGEAMAPVTKINPKRDEYICTGCNMQVTLEVVNALQSRNELQLCSVCARVLYLEGSIAATPPSHKTT